MSAEAIADAVVLLPRRYHEGQLSPYDILKGTGYFDRHADVSEQLIARALSNDPRLLDEWVQYSDDQRTDSGWFIREEPHGYLVAYFPKQRTGPDLEINRTRYADKLSACAAFVKHHIETIRE